MIDFHTNKEADTSCVTCSVRNLDIISYENHGYGHCFEAYVNHRLTSGRLPSNKQKEGVQQADRNKASKRGWKTRRSRILKEVHYHNCCQSHQVKKTRQLRMCVDFKDLNKACPKDGHPLPEIDWKVESLSFITSQGIYWYSKMSFGLNIAGATYQRLVDKAFHKQVGRNLEVYVDDLVIKIRTEEEIIRDIEETFKKLREINMKLNPKKCTFGVEEWMFLGYKVNTKGMKVCPDKVDVVLSLPSTKCLKDVHNLNRKLASLNSTVAIFPMLSGTGRKENYIVYFGTAIKTNGIRGLILTSPEGMEFTYALRFGFEATNNEAEYEALIAGLRIAEQMGIKNLQANVDSRLVANQVLTELTLRRKHISYTQAMKTLTYGTEAVIPAEIGMPTLRTAEVDVVRNDEALEVNLDLLEERREQAAIREAKSKRKMEKYYNAKVRSTSFKPGDLVYRNNDASHAEQGGKLGPKWEGPYEVTEALGKGAYKLRGRDGKQLPRTWNIRNLKKCYVYRT
ncbi:reverse transcriptase domain-containing protein [Tanacetum coccineum]